MRPTPPRGRARRPLTVSLRVLVPAICAALLAACTGDAVVGPPVTADPPGPGDGVVRLVGLEFEPETITIDAGKRVVWAWTDEVVHNVIGEPDVRSANLNGGSYAFTYAKPGSFRYQCTLHVGMTGTVIVR